jgi:hypothetical protein
MGTTLFRKHFGLFYSLGMAVFSWIFYFFLKGRLVSSARNILFSSDQIQTDILSSLFIASAVILEMIAFFIKVRRIRYIKGNREEFGNFYKIEKKEYDSNFTILYVLILIGTRLCLKGVVIFLFFTLIGLTNFSSMGAIIFIIIEFIMIMTGFKLITKGSKKTFSKKADLLSNIFLFFSGFVYMSLAWESLGQRAGEIGGTISNWQGFGELLISFFALSFFYFLLVFPIRFAYQLEEIEFTDTKKEERQLLLYYLFAVFLAVIPWLI